MEKISNAVYGVVCIVVIVILVATIGIPVIDDAQQEQVRTGQNATQLYAMAGGNTDVSIVKSDDVITVNDLVITNYGGVGTPLAICESFYIDVESESPSLGCSQGVFISDEFTISNGNVTFTPNGSAEQKTIPVTGNLFYASESGNYGNFYSTEPIYINEISTIYAITHHIGRLPESLSGIVVCSVLKGTLDTGLTATFAYNGTGGSAVIIENVTATVLNVTDGNGVKIVDPELNSTGYNIDFVATGDDGNLYSRNIATAIIAPIEYTYLSESGGMIIQLLGVIPIMLLLIPVMAAVAMISRRD